MECVLTQTLCLFFFGTHLSIFGFSASYQSLVYEMGISRNDGWSKIEIEFWVGIFQHPNWEKYVSVETENVPVQSFKHTIRLGWPFSKPHLAKALWPRRSLGAILKTGLSWARRVLLLNSQIRKALYSNQPKRQTDWWISVSPFTGYLAFAAPEKLRSGHWHVANCSLVPVRGLEIHTYSYPTYRCRWHQASRTIDELIHTYSSKLICSKWNWPFGKEACVQQHGHNETGVVCQHRPQHTKTSLVWVLSYPLTDVTWTIQHPQRHHKLPCSGGMITAAPQSLIKQ